MKFLVSANTTTHTLSPPVTMARAFLLVLLLALMAQAQAVVVAARPVVVAPRRPVVVVRGHRRMLAKDAHK